MKVPNHPPIELMNISRVLHALSDPIRLNLVKQLADCGELSCGELDLQVAKSTASHHFRVLREAGVIRMTPKGTQYINSLRRQDLQNRFPNVLDSVLTSFQNESTATEIL
ncbi:UNVERIFIED_CONTAM: hypothetical protein GTU68_023538 [Idotea baltica]|nr:hypothetical protein [Idotea baltica]